MNNSVRESIERHVAGLARFDSGDRIIDLARNLGKLCLNLLEENERLRRDDSCPYEYDDEKCMAHQRRQLAVVKAAQSHHSFCACLSEGWTDNCTLGGALARYNELNIRAALEMKQAGRANR